MKDFLIETIKEAGAIAKRYFQEGVADISEKSYKHDPLTEADTSVSDFFIAQVQKTYPEHGIFSEEEDHIINKGAEYEWVIDPIDGTKNFAIGIPDWCVSIALTKNGETIMGALYNPISEQLFFAEKGKGAYLDNVQIHVNNTQRVQGSFGHIIRSAGGGVYGDYFDRYGRLYSRIVTETNSRLVNFGNVFHMAFVATGGIDYAIAIQA